MKPLLTIFLFALLLAGCAKEDTNTTSKPTETLVGTWQGDDVGPFFSGDSYHFVFDADGGFLLKQLFTTDNIVASDPCRQARYMYIRGTYETTDSTIQMHGEFCDSTFTVAQPDPCSHQTTFSRWHLYYFENGGLTFRYSKFNDMKILLHRE